MKYKTIYCDPPWNMSGSGLFKRLSAGEKYTVMKLQDIKNMKDFIQQLADEDCHLYMWVTSNFLQDGLDTMKHWGFRYITNVVWNKTTGCGMGQYFRTQHEICLFGTKGKTQLNKKQYVVSVISAPRREHSRKPEQMYDLIEKVSPGPYIELFARNTREGWDSWGNEVGKFDKGETE